MAIDLDDFEVEEAEIDMTPMIDVTFLLIIFFMVVSDMSALDLADLVLPYADQAHTGRIEDPEDNPSIVVNVLEDGTIEIRGEKYATKKETANGLMTIHDFIKFEAEAVGREPAPPENPGLKPSKLRLLIRADRNTRFKNVGYVFEACSKNGVYKTSLGATKEPMK